MEFRVIPCIKIDGAIEALREPVSQYAWGSSLNANEERDWEDYIIEIADTIDRLEEIDRDAAEDQLYGLLQQVSTMGVTELILSFD